MVKIETRCVKFKLPNGKCVDILSEVFEEVIKFIQLNQNTPESGGCILGYKHASTGNFSLEYITVPQKEDKCNRISFRILDSIHRKLINLAKRKRSYYMGVWHTHPQTNPIPSIIDIDDWKDTLKKDNTGCEYIFFIIVGTINLRVWVGEFDTRKVTEIYEWKKVNGLYEKQNN